MKIPTAPQMSEEADKNSTTTTDSLKYVETFSKRNFLVISHAISSILHFGMYLFLFIEWNKTGIEQLGHFQIISLSIIGVLLFILALLVFLLYKMEMKLHPHTGKFFKTWPLLHIGLSTIYQFVTQILVSHNVNYQRPSLYTAYSTTVSVATHLILHSIEVFF